MRSFLSKRALLGVALALGLSYFVVARKAVEADPTDPSTPSGTGTEPEPITGSPSWPEPGEETGPIDPFAAPEPGNVLVEELSPPEQAYVAANADATGWSNVHSGFSVASEEAAEKAQAAKAAALLGLESLGDTGVTP